MKTTFYKNEIILQPETEFEASFLQEKKFKFVNRLFKHPVINPNDNILQTDIIVGLEIVPESSNKGKGGQR